MEFKLAPTKFNLEVFATSKCQLKKYCLYHFLRKARLVWDTNSLTVGCKMLFLQTYMWQFDVVSTKFLQLSSIYSILYRVLALQKYIIGFSKFSKAGLQQRPLQRGGRRWEKQKGLQLPPPTHLLPYTMRTNLLNSCNLVSINKNVVFYAFLVVRIY